MKLQDPIEEIREVRRKISAEHGHDMERLVKHYQEMEKDYQDQMIKTRNSLATSGTEKKSR